MADLAKLLHCPFCGGEADAYCRKGRYGLFGYIACERCGVETRKKRLSGNNVNDPNVFDQFAFDELASIWNQRWCKCQTD